MPSLREIRDFAPERPIARFQENENPKLRLRPMLLPSSRPTVAARTFVSRMAERILAGQSASFK